MLTVICFILFFVVSIKIIERENQTVELPRSQRDSDSGDEDEEPHIDLVSEEQHRHFRDELLRLDTTPVDSSDVVLHQPLQAELVA